MKKIFLAVASISILAAPFVTFAVDNDFEIIPKSNTDVSTDVTNVGKA